jgi:hypothetical protein
MHLTGLQDSYAKYLSVCLSIYLPILYAKFSLFGSSNILINPIIYPHQQMEILDKLVYIIGPVVAAIALFIRYRWRKQEKMERKKEK